MPGPSLRPPATLASRSPSALSRSGGAGPTPAWRRPRSHLRAEPAAYLRRRSRGVPGGRLSRRLSLEPPRALLHAGGASLRAHGTRGADAAALGAGPRPLGAPRRSARTSGSYPRAPTSGGSPRAPRGPN